MIHRAVIAHADWLKDPNTGPNFYLPDLSRESEDEDLALEPIARVYDPFRDMEGLDLLNHLPGKYPALIVTPASPVDVAGEVNQDEQDSSGVDLLIKLLADEVRAPAALRKQAYYLNALNLSISAFYAETEGARAARQRGPVQIISCLGRGYALAYEPIGSAFVTGEYLLRCSTRNTEGQL